MGITVVSPFGEKWFGADSWDQDEYGDLTLAKNGSVIARFRHEVWAGFWTDDAETAEPKDS